MLILLINNATASYKASFLVLRIVIKLFMTSLIDGSLMGKATLLAGKSVKETELQLGLNM
jgi:hypothetical protein